MAGGEYSSESPGRVVTRGDERAQLVVAPGRLELRIVGWNRSALYVDFVSGAAGYERRANRFGALHRAVGLRRGVRPRVFDATAGLGRDAFRLAYAGCDVTAVERSDLLHGLLADGLARALGDREIAERLDGRLRVWHADARDLLRRLMKRAAARESPQEPLPDVVYLDPMFPAKRKSALVKQEMRMLRQIVGDDPDAGELFELAQRVALQRVVVKRMHDAPPLAPAVSHSCGDRTTRYDVYMRCAQLAERPGPNGGAVARA